MEYLAWPIVALILGIVFLVMFRRNIGGSIDKLQKIERLGVSMGTGQTQTAPENRSSGFQEMMDPLNSPLLLQQEKIIRDGLKSKGITNEQEIIQILTRALAKASFGLRWEQAERFIFGSQLGVLVAMNANALGLTIQQAKEFYDAATRQFPATYKNYRFEQWLQYLEGYQLISKGGNGYQITIEGKEFMAWLIYIGRTHQRPN
jgi:hypothetical protein